jgi:hypothetical protein
MQRSSQTVSQAGGQACMHVNMMANDRQANEAAGNQTSKNISGQVGNEIGSVRWVRSLGPLAASICWSSFVGLFFGSVSWVRLLGPSVTSRAGYVQWIRLLVRPLSPFVASFRRVCSFSLFVGFAGSVWQVRPWDPFVGPVRGVRAFDPFVGSVCWVRSLGPFVGSVRRGRISVEGERS